MTMGDREDSDARVIVNPADVKLRSFSTKARPCLCMYVALCPGYGLWHAPETCGRAGAQRECAGVLQGRCRVRGLHGVGICCLGRAVPCCLISWLTGILCNMASQLATPVCTCGTALSRSKRSRFPLRARRCRHWRPNRLQAAVRLACSWQHRQPEQPARFKQVMAYGLRRLPRKAGGAPGEQCLQTVAQQSSQRLLFRSAVPLFSTLQQTLNGQHLMVKGFRWQAGP